MVNWISNGDTSSGLMLVAVAGRVELDLRDDDQPELRTAEHVFPPGERRLAVAQTIDSAPPSAGATLAYSKRLLAIIISVPISRCSFLFAHTRCILQAMSRLGD